MKFIYWTTLRNGGDGRRPSGVGYTRSKIHRSEDGVLTLCGIDTDSDRFGGLHTKVTDAPPDGGRQVCRRCEHRVT